MKCGDRKHDKTKAVETVREVIQDPFIGHTLSRRRT
jgi:hypothetical protein